MVKRPTNKRKTNSNTINSVLTDNKTSPKSKQQIDKEYYQKNKERKKQQRKARYQQDKETERAKQKQRYLKKKAQEQLTTKQIQAKYYQAINIKILLTLKEYTELNQQKRKLWLDFTATLHQLSQGITTIEEVMRLEQLATQLIKDYRETAKSEVKKGKNWNALDYDEQQRLIRYWGYEKTRIENGYLTAAEELEKQSQEYLKEIERAKFHEERGKKGCECYQCAESKRIQGEIKKELFKEDKTKKEQCPECKKWVKELDEESGVCKSCKKKYE